MRNLDAKYKAIPFWSWNDELDEKELVKQVEWMHENGFGGFFMHARGGLTTEYLSEKWFSCIDACAKRAQELGMEAYAYDENGWPSGFAGGKLLEDIENHDRFLTHKMGAFDKDALASFEIRGERLVRVTASDKECLNVYSNYSPSTADILNPEVVDKFIALTHEEYHKRNKYGIKGFFTDEPQYFRWNQPYTKVLPAYFQEVYGEDILDRIGLLFVEKEGYRDFRYKYWLAMQTLMLKNFAEKIYNWCEEHGYKLTGHYIDENTLEGQLLCCGAIMPFYEFEHIPGIDWLGRFVRSEIPPKQVGSVAAQLGKKQVLTEMYAMCGWDASPRDLKRLAQCQFVSGVNLACQHLLPYSEHGQRKRDYPPHFSSINPWVKKNMRAFNDYFSVLGAILSESEEVVNTGVLHPVRSLYFDYKHTGSYDDGAKYPIDIAFRRFCEDMTAKQLPHHFIDETLLSRHGRVEGDKLILGNCTYTYLILPTIYTMGKETERMLRAFVEGGGKVFLYDGKPAFLEGEPYDYPYLHSNITLDEILKAQPFTASENPHVRTAFRRDSEGRSFIYAVNVGEETSVTFETGKPSFEAYDVMKDCYTTLGTTVHFDKDASYLLYLSDKEPLPKKTLKPLPLGNRFTVDKTDNNYLTLDMVSYSFDGENYSEPLLHMGVFNELLKKRYAGKLYLKYTFAVDEIPEKCKLMVENSHILSVSINGKTVEKIGVCEDEREFFLFDIAPYITKGENAVVLTIDYYQSEQVYFVLFGNATESLKNCLAYDTDIEPVYLVGDFGVFGDMKPGKKENIVLGENFRLGKQKSEISDLIAEGFPFFAGDITLRTNLSLTETDYELVIDKPFMLLDVAVNGKKVDTLMFDYRLDLSDYLVKGENEITLTLTVSNRNLFGPFHTLEQENISVGPFSFERLGTWENGKSPLVAPHYAFIRTIV